MRSSYAHIEKLHTVLADRMEKRYTEMNDHVTDVRLKFVDETSFGELIDSQSNPSIAYTFTMAPSEGDVWNNPAVWTYANDVGYAFLGLRGIEKVEGPLIEPERKVMAEYLLADLADLEEVWKPIAPLRVSDAELETNADHIGCLERTEQIIIVAWECHTQHANGLISLSYPRSAMEKIVDKLAVWANAN